MQLWPGKSGKAGNLGDQRWFLMLLLVDSKSLCVDRKDASVFGNGVLVCPHWRNVVVLLQNFFKIVNSSPKPMLRALALNKFTLGGCGLWLAGSWLICSDSRNLSPRLSKIIPC